MKKTYLNPEMQVVTIELTTVLAASPNAEITEGTVNAGEIEAPEFDLDDEEDEELYW